VQAPRFVRRRADAGLAHQTVGVGKYFALGANEAQESRSQSLLGPGQRAKDVDLAAKLFTILGIRALGLERFPDW
jgi:hypothetical protein